MRLVCPSCGAIASLDAWQRDALARQLMAAVTAMPAPLLPHLLSYLTLFRPAKSSLSWKKANRVVADLAALVATGHVQVQGRVARPCPPSLWARGLEQMIERRGSLSLPLKNHNYLRQIVYTLADQEDASNEAARRERELTGNHRPPEDRHGDDLSPIMRQYIEKHGDPLQRMEGGADGK